MLGKTIVLEVGKSCSIERRNVGILADGNSTLSVYVQLSQSISMGVSELFATVACFEFAYFAAPRSAQSLFMSLYYCTVGLASFVGTGYITLFSSTASELDFRVSFEVRSIVLIVIVSSVHRSRRSIRNFSIISSFSVVFN